MIVINESTNNRKLYVRFGDIPSDEHSNVYRNSEIVDEERGVSVWDAMEANGKIYPKLPDNPSEEAIHDYFMLLFSNRPVYVLTGTELSTRGTDDEPLLRDVSIVEEINYDYFKR